MQKMSSGRGAGPSHGAQALLYSAEEPETLRGPQFHYAWGDEAARWSHGATTLANLRMGLRLGEKPRLLLTTTPKPLPWLKALMADAACSVARGRTFDNENNLPRAFIKAVLRDYGGTRLGRQELDGELIEEVEGALWTRATFEDRRVRTAPALVRVVVAVDPPASSGPSADACGIVAVGLGADGRAYVLGDCSVQGASPDNWARAVVAAADTYGADKVVAEVNNGGDMVRSVLNAEDAALPVAGTISIGEVQSLLKREFPDVTISKIRFLENEGLVAPERTPSGYRRFSQFDVDRLREVLRLQRDEYLPLQVIREQLAEGREVHSTRGARLTSWKDAERVLAGFPDGRADEGPTAGPASLLGLEIANEHGWSAPAGGQPALGASEWKDGVQ